MMVKATKDTVAADMQPPNYRGAVQRIRTITGKKEKIAAVNGEISDIWAKVEGHKVNKIAGRIFLLLDGKSEDRLEIFRDLNGLIDAAGWPDAGADLVDEAQGNVVELRAGGKKKAGSPEDDEAQLAEIEAEAGKSPADQGNDFLARARGHLAGGKSETGETYQGTDEDLNPGGDDTTDGDDAE